MGLKECKNLPMTSNESPSAAHFALARAVVELEEHVSTRGWDGPTSVFALVRTADALANDPSLAQLLPAQVVQDAQQDPQLLMSIEQDGLPEAVDLEDLLAQLAWPGEVDGAALSVERSVLPPQAEQAAGAISDDDERLAFLANHPEREDVRMVVGVLRGGESWCALRMRSHDEATQVVQGSDLVPGLVAALKATLV